MGLVFLETRVQARIIPSSFTLELEGDVHFYEHPKTAFPDPVFGKFDGQVTGLVIEKLDNNVDWLRQYPHDYWIGGVHASSQ